MAESAFPNPDHDGGSHERSGIAPWTLKCGQVAANQEVICHK